MWDNGWDRLTHCHLAFSQNQSHQEVSKISFLLYTPKGRTQNALKLSPHTGHRNQANNKQRIQVLDRPIQKSVHKFYFSTDIHFYNGKAQQSAYTPTKRLLTFNVQGLNDIVIYQFEVLMTNPVLHISFPARKEVVHNCNLMAIHHQFVSKMRTHKPCSSSYLRQDSWYKFLFLFTETPDKGYKHEDRRTVAFRSLLTPGETTPFPCFIFFNAIFTAFKISRDTLDIFHHCQPRSSANHSYQQNLFFRLDNFPVFLQIGLCPFMRQQSLKRPKKVRGELSVIPISEKKDNRMPGCFCVSFVISEMSNPDFVWFKWETVGCSKYYKFFPSSEKEGRVFLDESKSSRTLI